MILVYILIFIASYLLWLYVGLHEILAAGLMGMSLTALLYEGLGYIIRRVRLWLTARRRKIKMLCYVSHLSGLPVLPQQKLMLGLDRDHLLLYAQSFEQEYSRDELRSIYIAPAKLGLDAPELSAFIARHRPEKKLFLAAFSEHYIPRQRESLLLLAVRPEGEQTQVIVLAAHASPSRLLKELRRQSWQQIELPGNLSRKERA